MKYYRKLKQAQEENPTARWFYCDKKGIGGQTRWYCSRRILKKAQEQLEQKGYGADVAFKMGFNIFNL
jgi:glutamine synthetase